MTIDMANNFVDKGTEVFNFLANSNSKSGFDFTSTTMLQIIAIVAVVIIFYLALTMKKTVTKGIKKELNVDDLEKKIDNLIDETRVLQEKANDVAARADSKNVGISDSIFNIMQDLQTMKKCIGDGTLESKLKLIKDALVFEIKEIRNLINSRKQFSNEEMYYFISNRFQLSIANIVGHYIRIIEQNDLFRRKNMLMNNIKNDLAIRVNEGRQFIYTLNFDKKILDVVFSNTDESMLYAESVIIGMFNQFYAIGEENVTKNDYADLRDNFRQFGDEIKFKTDQMLRQKILGENN